MKAREHRKHLLGFTGLFWELLDRYRGDSSFWPRGGQGGLYAHTGQWRSGDQLIALPVGVGGQQRTAPQPGRLLGSLQDHRPSWVPLPLPLTPNPAVSWKGEGCPPPSL